MTSVKRHVTLVYLRKCHAFPPQFQHGFQTKSMFARGILVRTDEQYGNSAERQRAKEEMESQLGDLDRLIEFFSSF